MPEMGIIMPENRDGLRQLAKWAIIIFTLCSLIYLGLRHIRAVAKAFAGVFCLLKPLFFGLILALILNVPMRFLEERFLRKLRFQKGRRPLAIFFALLFVILLVTGLAFLVLPELARAIELIVEIVDEWLSRLNMQGQDTSFSQSPWLSFLADIDWREFTHTVKNYFKSHGSFLIYQAMDVIQALTGAIVTGVLTLTFSIYILARKEILKKQVCRLIRAWLPVTFAKNLLHVAAVCKNTFQLFIVGQATEAVILGVLCLIGMLLLQLPYAPMVSALVGVTALIPVVGAFVGTLVGAVILFTVKPVKALVFVLFFVILQQVEGNFIYPKVVGGKINLPALWVLAAVMAGGSLAGAPGMFLGVPVTSAVYALLKEATEKRERDKGL